MIARREKLLGSLAFDAMTNLYPSCPHILARDLATITELENLHEGSPDLNLALADPRVHGVGLALFGQQRYVECLAMLTKIYAVFGNIATNHQHSIIATGILICCMKTEKEKAVLERWAEKLRKHCILGAGTLQEVREGSEPTIPEELKKFGIEFFNDVD